MPPQLLFLVVLLALVGALVLRSQQNQKDKQAASKDAARLKTLEQQLQNTQAQLDELHKRLHNVEDIVTDTKFVDPPLTGREAIDLQAEIRALKDKLNRL